MYLRSSSLGWDEEYRMRDSVVAMLKLRGNNGEN